MDPLSSQGGCNFALLRAVVYKIRADFQNCRNWAWNPEFEKFPDVEHGNIISTPGDQNWAYFRATGSVFQDTSRFSNCHSWAILADYPNCRIWAWNPVLQECRSAGMVVIQTTIARNGGHRTYNTRNVGSTRPLFLVTLVRDGPTKLKVIGPR